MSSTEEVKDPNSWEEKARVLLEKCPYTVWQRPGGGPVDLKASLVVTFMGMQARLDGHPSFARSLPPVVAAMATPS